MHAQLLSIFIMIARESILKTGQNMIAFCLSFGVKDSGDDIKCKTNLMINYVCMVGINVNR